MTEINSNQNQIVVGYWAIRGLAEPIRLVLQYTKTPFTAKTYHQGDAPDYSRDEWFNEKFILGLDFPNLPYLIDGDLKITQSKAILYYLGRKFNLMGTNPKERAHVLMLCEDAYDLRAKFAGLCYSPDGDTQTKKQSFIDTILVEYLKKFDQYLSKSTSNYFVGSQITIADFQLFEYLDVCLYLDEKQTLIEQYPNIKRFLNTIRNSPELKDYITNVLDQVPFHRKDAKIGGKLIERK